MKAPTPLPSVEQVAAHEFFKGWWAGGAVFGLNGLVIGYLLAQHL